MSQTPLFLVLFSQRVRLFNLPGVIGDSWTDSQLRNWQNGLKKFAGRCAVLAAAVGFAALPIAVQAAAVDHASEIKALLFRHGKKASFSLRDANGEEIVAINEGMALAPASIAKSVSTGCSLRELGPHFQFSTEFGYVGKIEGEKLKGSLVVRGHGDPSIVIEDVKEVIERLRSLYGIKEIEGPLIFDASYFGTARLAMAEGFEGDSGRSFASDLTPIGFNQNSFSFWVAPSHRGRDTVAAVFPIDALKLSVRNHVKVNGGNSVSVAYDPDKLNASLDGGLSEDSEPKAIYRAVPDPYQYYANILHALWKQQGGEWKDSSFKVETGKVKMVTLMTQSSRPLAKILMDVNKLSLNMGAELTLLAAGARAKGEPANYTKALNFLEACLKEAGVKDDGIRLTNASGLSREALIKTASLTQFLLFMSKGSYAPEYLSSFSLLGTDGTTKSRLTEFAGRGRVKTGSIAGVSSIAGYLSGKDGKMYTFALIMNGVNQADPDIKKTQDKILAKILNDR